MSVEPASRRSLAADEVAVLGDRAPKLHPVQPVVAEVIARRVGGQGAVRAESLYWEARAQQLAGRTAKANATYREFLDQAASRRSLRRLVTAAREHLA